MRLWRLFTSVNFAVVQIVAIAVLAVFGMTIRQLPGFAFRSAADYATEMDRIRVGLRAVSSASPWSTSWSGSSCSTSSRRRRSRVALLVLVVSIIVCTLDRTPRLWQQSAAIRVVQPPAYFDPRLPDRVSIAPGPGLSTAAVAGALRRHRFSVREATAPDGSRFLYGDRNRWTKLATLVSHLGLILFLVAGLVTARFGDEQGLVVAEGDTLTVQPIGTPGLLLVQNRAFEAPGLETGMAERLHHRPRRLPRRPAPRREDHPGQRPALDRRLHVPPERLRAGARPRDPLDGRRLGALVRSRAAHGHGRRAAVRRHAGAGTAVRPGAPARPDPGGDRCLGDRCRTP